MAKGRWVKYETTMLISPDPNATLREIATAACILGLQVHIHSEPIRSKCPFLMDAWKRLVKYERFGG
jgi:hypothetical protein